MHYTVRCSATATITERWQVEADSPDAAIEAVENGEGTFICQIDCDGEHDRCDFEAVPAELGDSIGLSSVSHEMLSLIEQVARFTTTDEAAGVDLGNDLAMDGIIKRCRALAKKANGGAA